MTSAFGVEGWVINVSIARAPRIPFWLSIIMKKGRPPQDAPNHPTLTQTPYGNTNR
jgi:hypothetical protein